MNIYFLSKINHYLSLSSARWIQSKPYHPKSLISMLTLISHLHLGLRCGLFPQVSSRKLCMYLSSPMCATFPYFHLLLNIVTKIMSRKHNQQRRSLCNILLSLLASFVLGPNMFLIVYFWKYVFFHFIWETHTSIKCYR